MSVVASWERIENWLQGNGIEPKPPLEATTLTAAQALGHPLPADLTESLLRHDGSPRTLVPPRWTLLPLQTSLDVWKRKTDDLAARQAAEIEEIDEDEEEDFSAVEEGEEDAFWGWNAAWFPVAGDGGGCHLVVDLRTGVLGEHDPETGTRFGSPWRSVAELLEATAAALHGEDPEWRAAVVEWGIDWTRAG
ncbi:SMI1/KNR4 family protein [Lentzea sp. NPDC005914]|uniref:SMI1/KNR4 family protein n=1 Tax=Lentzea sp. NPDC005914 TaxID=3154572 RepID=UPI0033C62A00